MSQFENPVDTTPEVAVATEVRAAFEQSVGMIPLLCRTTRETGLTHDFDDGRVSVAIQVFEDQIDPSRTSLGISANLDGERLKVRSGDTRPLNSEDEYLAKAILERAYLEVSEDRAEWLRTFTQVFFTDHEDYDLASFEATVANLLSSAPDVVTERTVGECCLVTEDSRSLAAKMTVTKKVWADVIADQTTSVVMQVCGRDDVYTYVHGEDGTETLLAADRMSTMVGVSESQAMTRPNATEVTDMVLEPLTAEINTIVSTGLESY